MKHLPVRLALALALVALAPSARVAAQQATTVAAGDVLEFGTMWTFDAPPVDYWRTRYGFEAHEAWLEHLRLAAVRLPGCSASFVSDEGLVLTNHHCVRSCVAQVSPEDANYLRTGFVAEDRGQEVQCPGMYVDQLVSIEDVTDRIRSMVTANAGAAEAARRSAAIEEVRAACEERSDLRCQVVPFYNGGMFSLYTYRRYGDLRLVFAPELEAAHFGGDPDNFTYPRFALDAAFVRVYEDGRPFRPDHFLEWSEAGAGDGEPVFVVGNPGSTGRLLTVAQMEYLRDVDYPARLADYDRRLAVLRGLAAESPEAARELETGILGLENSRKATAGYLAGLLDASIMTRKEAFEDDFRARIQSDPGLGARFGGAWDAIADAQLELATFALQARYYAMNGSGLLGTSLGLVRGVRQAELPDAERLPAYRGQGLERARQTLLRDGPVDAEQERRHLAVWLTAALDELGPRDRLVTALLAGRTPEQAAHALVAASLVGDVAERRRILDGGVSALDGWGDPLVAAARELEPVATSYVKRAAALNGVVAENGAKLGEAIHAAYGTALPPDATFTLRISDGVVKGFPMNGTLAPYKTSFYGLFARSAEFDHQPPFEVAERWRAAEGSLDMETPFNFVSTADIIGGNSGSPVVNRAGQVVGVVFDGNIEMLPNRFIFTDEVSRCVSVHSLAITEALRKVYGASHVADEIQGVGR